MGRSETRHQAERTIRRRLNTPWVRDWVVWLGRPRGKLRKHGNSAFDRHDLDPHWEFETSHSDKKRMPADDQL